MSVRIEEPRPIGLRDKTSACCNSTFHFDLIFQAMWLYRIGLTLCSAVLVSGVFVWYEQPPKYDDPCTMHVIGRDPGEMLSAHSNPNCEEGGLIWYGVWGRIHSTIILNADPSQEFEICLTGGLAESVYVWWDSHRDYWMPVGFQQWHSEISDWQRCRLSTNGTIDLYFEPPWGKKHYIAYVSWELRPLTTEQHQGAWDELETKRKPPLVYEEGKGPQEAAAENKPSDDYMYSDVFVDTFLEYALFVAALVVACAAVGVSRQLWNVRKFNSETEKSIRVERKRKKLKEIVDFLVRATDGISSGPIPMIGIESLNVFQQERPCGMYRVGRTEAKLLIDERRFLDVLSSYLFGCCFAAEIL
ncbi:hypothetical protein CAPTEDRAFT_212569 [Capitella teleta]|uniref:Uncharacterized protein n=1 Tax=Capitella teleta TaxID=283909 RepID=R7UTS7_CAPTE|nr:hypothetical protein CAPTEDRAFT_212569 [Capitella teleta]|eukprot:ELU09555.1 hypothetical protein CAPTEDRAFT_212569 [Capitella teleta]